MISTIKTSMKGITLFAFTLIMTFATNTVFAKSSGTDKTTVKAREAVEQASPDDWKTYAESAEKCIRKNVNMKEAAAWLDQSLEIKETAYNLKVKGLYYEKNNLPQEALQFYIKSLKAGIESDVNYTDEDTQRKVTELMKKV